MMKPISRRAALGIIGAGFVGAGAGKAAGSSSPIDITWRDLIPAQGDGVEIEVVRGIIQHGELERPEGQPPAATVTTEYDGKRVRLPGYIVPLEYDGTGVTAFILVPYVGACIHVPPPPANQLVMVTSDKPYESSGLFEPVSVTGEFTAAVTGTELAEIGYSISNARVVPYE